MTYPQIYTKKKSVNTNAERRAKALWKIFFPFMCWWRELTTEKNGKLARIPKPHHLGKCVKSKSHNFSSSFFPFLPSRGKHSFDKKQRKSCNRSMRMKYFCVLGIGRRIARQFPKISIFIKDSMSREERAKAFFVIRRGGLGKAKGGGGDRPTKGKQLHDEIRKSWEFFFSSPPPPALAEIIFDDGILALPLIALLLFRAIARPWTLFRRKTCVRLVTLSRWWFFGGRVSV